MKIKLPKPVLVALAAFGVLEDELEAVTNEAAAKDPAFADGGAAIIAFLVEKLEVHLGLQAAEALAANIVAQILGRAPGYDPDHGMDA